MIPLPGVRTSLGNVTYQESSALLTHILKAFITWNWQRWYQKKKIVSWFKLAWGHRSATGEQESIFMQSPSFKNIMCYDFLFTPSLSFLLLFLISSVHLWALIWYFYSNTLLSKISMHSIPTPEDNNGNKNKNRKRWVCN